MKTIQISTFESFLIEKALKNYKSLVQKEDFPDRSIVTKQYVEMMIEQIESKLRLKSKNRQGLR